MWTGHQRGAGFIDMNMEPGNWMRSERSELPGPGRGGESPQESQKVSGGKMKKIQGTVVLKADEKKIQVWNEHLATFMKIKCEYVFLVPNRK